MQRALSLSLAAAALVAVPLAAQNQNVTVLKNMTRSGTTSYAGVWGYTAPDGREFALVGCRNGTWVVETTDPQNPVERGFFTASNSTWREITGYKHWVYSVSENHGGIRVIDMSNPAAPTSPGYVFQSGSNSWRNTHSISVDPGAGRLYANGTNLGMVILDLGANPAAPTYLGRYTGQYVHDCYVRNGKGYLAEINRGYIRIADVTTPTSVTTISQTTTPGAFTHNVWVTDDEELMITSDENSTGFLQAYDIRNPATPMPLGSYKIPGAVVHNVFLIGRTGYMAAYVAGFHMVDLADPTNIPKLASYDTSSAGSGYNGAWGAYPFTDSGVIYVSDMQTGFWVLQVDCGHLNRYGNGTPWATGGVPRAIFDGASPRVGAAGMRMELTGLAPSSPFVLVLSANQASQTVFGIDLLVDLNGALIVSGQADASGNANLPMPIPANPGLANAKIHAQVIGAAGGALYASRGMWFGICP